MTKAVIGLQELAERVENAYHELLDGGDVELAAQTMRGACRELDEALPEGIAEEERVEALHLLADLASELGDEATLKRAAGELARHFEPEDDADLDSVVDDMIGPWRCPEAAEMLLERLAGQVDEETLAELKEEVAEARHAVDDAPMSVDQVLALRAALLAQGVVVEEEDGFLVQEADEDDPLALTRAWLEGQDLDTELCLEWIEDASQCESDADVVLSLQPAQVYDVLAHWELEGVARRYWVAAEEDMGEIYEGWTAVSPDERYVAMFEDDEEVAYLYVYDQETEELAAAPLWLYNRVEAPAGQELEARGEDAGPIMPAAFMLDAAPREAEPETLDLLWSDDCQKIAVKVDGELLGYVDLTSGFGYSKGLKKECELGRPLPKGFTWAD